MRAKKIADGRCVKTIVGTRPMRRERGAAMREEMEERMPATKKSEPRVAGVRE